MSRWQRMVLAALVGTAAMPALVPWQPACAANAQEMSSLSGDLTDMLVILAGTAAVFDSPRINAALHDPVPLLAPDGRKLDVLKVKTLLKTAGFKPWTERPTVWVVQAAGENSLDVLSADPRFQAEAKSRGLPVSLVRSTDSDAHAVAALAAGNELPALPGLLAGHQADALVIVHQQGNGAAHWQLLQPGRHLEGKLSAGSDVTALLPHVLCEALSVASQWPEAYGRPIIMLRNVGSMADFAAAESALKQLKGVHGVSLVRLDGGTAYFAVDDMAAGALADALAGEPRFAADNTPADIKPLVAQGRAQGSPVFARIWTPAAPADKTGRLQ